MLERFEREMFAVASSQQFETSSDKQFTYEVYFEIQLQVGIDQKLAILGEPEGLGSWNDVIFLLERTEDDEWISTKPVLVSSQKSYFQYKYCVVSANHDGSLQVDYWGLGVNRVADLRLHEINEEKNGFR